MRNATSPKPPTLSAGRYELIEIMARGGQGEIWSATDRKHDRRVVVKLLNEAAAKSADSVERLRRERAALLALDGTCAVKVLDNEATHRGAPCLIMEHLSGVDLETRLTEFEKDGRKLEFGEIRQVLEPLVQTLHKAHKQGIVHRDLKPANIFLLDDGGVRLIDFGFARLESEERITAFGVVMGSPCYIAPEVWNGHANESGVGVDVYSFGVIVFRMFAGSPPFETASLVEMRELATKAPRPSLKGLRPDVPSSVDDWAQRALATDPARRFSSIRRAWDELCDAVEEPQSVNWGRIPRALAAGLKPSRVAEVLRRAGAVLWTSRPADVAPTPSDEATQSVATALLREPSVSRTSEPRRRRRRRKTASKRTRKARQARRRARARAS
jgi:serine/threonine-protein kinase